MDGEESPARRSIPPGAEPMIKGSVLRAFVHYYTVQQGSDALDDVLRRVPAEVRRAFDGSRPAFGVLPWRWYPARYVHAMLDAVGEGLSDEERLAMARASARHAIDAMIRGVFKWVLESVTSPHMYARHIQRIWRGLHDTGRRQITFKSPREAESVVEDWGGHHPILCEVVGETTVAVFEAMGCREVRSERLSCVSRGDPRCATRITWASY